jgi:PAS domain-containing protein
MDFYDTFHARSTIPIKNHDAKTSFILEEQTKTPQNTEGFPISRLPPELRDMVYTHYFHSIPAILITHSSLDSWNQDFKLINHVALALSSFYFTSSIPQSLFFENTTFTFACPFTLRDFSALSPLHTQIRHVRIQYGSIGKQSPDWIFVLNSCLERLESVVFIVGYMENVAEGQKVSVWWDCVRNAMREAILAREKWRERGRGKMVMVRVEDEHGEHIIEEHIDGSFKTRMDVRRYSSIGRPLMKYENTS